MWMLAPCGWALACFAGGVAAAPARKRAERAWIERSAALTRTVKASGDVAEFRRDLREHRERLREIVRAAGTPPPPVLELHRSMILMHALLHAASECHAGGRLLCPPDLMRQIEEQLAVGFRQLDAVEKAPS
jgi:hypothetical protein